MFNKLLKRRNQNLRYISMIRLLRELVNKLVMFFLPIYFFNLHFPFWDQLNYRLLASGQESLSGLQIGIFNIAILYILQRLTAFISSITIAKLTVKRGTRHAFIMGHFLYALFVVLLLLSQQQPYWAFLAMVIDGLQVNYFWNSYYYFLSRHSAHTNMGSNLGSLNLLLNIITMIAPALGGLIIGHIDYQLLFLLGLILIGLGMILAILLDNVKVHDRISWPEFLSWMNEPGFRRLAGTFAGRYLNDAMLNLWPLYVFILLGSTDSVGWLYSLSLLLAMIINYAMGSRLDQQKSRKPYVLSGGVLSVCWLMRSFVGSIWSIAVVNTLHKITASYHWLFFDRTWLLRGKGRESLSYLTYREMIYSLAAVSFWVLVFFLFYFFQDAWQALFALAAVGVLLTLLVREHQGDI